MQRLVQPPGFRQDANSKSTSARAQTGSVTFFLGRRGRRQRRAASGAPRCMGRPAPPSTRCELRGWTMRKTYLMASIFVATALLGAGCKAREMRGCRRARRGLPRSTNLELEDDFSGCSRTPGVSRVVRASTRPATRSSVFRRRHGPQHEAWRCYEQCPSPIDGRLPPIGFHFSLRPAPRCSEPRAARTSASPHPRRLRLSRPRLPTPWATT